MENTKKIELHDVLYVPDIAGILYSITKHGSQPYCSFMINNVATIVGFPIFTLLAKINKEITLDSDRPFKDRHSHPDYTNLLNEFNNNTVRLIHDKSDIPKISNKDSTVYNLHRVEYASIKV